MELSVTPEQATGADATAPVPLGATGGMPERMFRVGPPVLDGDVVRASMTTGRWVLDAAGHPTAGALTVLLDDVLGLAALLRRPADRWSVTTELAIELCGRLPDDGSRVHAEARLVADDASGGFAQGRVLDGHGRVLALATARGRYVPGVPPRPAPPPALADDDHRGVADLLGATVEAGDGGLEVHLEPSAALHNPRGVVHGGLATAASELAGRLALHAGDGGGASDAPALMTSSIRIALVRPTPADRELVYATDVVHRGRSFGVVHVTGGARGGPVSTAATVTAQAGPGGGP